MTLESVARQPYSRAGRNSKAIAVSVGFRPVNIGEMECSVLNCREQGERAVFTVGSPGAGSEVAGTIEYCPATIRRPLVNGRLVTGQNEFPPKHAAIFVEEIRSDGYTHVAPMVRVGDG